MIDSIYINGNGDWGGFSSALLLIDRASYKRRRSAMLLLFCDSRLNSSASALSWLAFSDSNRAFSKICWSNKGESVI